MPCAWPVNTQKIISGGSPGEAGSKLERDRWHEACYGEALYGREQGIRGQRRDEKAASEGQTGESAQLILDERGPSKSKSRWKIGSQKLGPIDRLGWQRITPTTFLAGEDGVPHKGESSSH